jgi:YVTN family beta-propeller protein
MKYLFISVTTFCISVLFISGCSETTDAPPVIDEQFNGFENFAIAEILVKGCALPDCHRGATAEHGLSFESYSEMIKGSIGRPLNGHHHKIGKPAHESVYGGSPVIPFDAENSLLYQLITGNIEDETQRMPYEKTPLSQSQIEILKTWINNGARDFNGNVPYSASNKIYICNQWSDEIYVVDTDYNVVSGIINVDVNQSIPDQPHNIQIRGNYYYVTLISAGQFLKIDLNTNLITGRVTGLTAPGMIMISPDGKTAYVSKSSTAPGSYSEIYVIDTETMTRQQQDINLPVFGLPHGIWLTKDGSKLYAANMKDDRIYVANTATKEIEDVISLSPALQPIHEPMHIYLSPDDKYLYINNRKSRLFMVIDTETHDLLAEIPIKNHPMQAAVSPDGNKIYLVSHHEPFITEVEKNGESWTITKELRNDEIFHHLYGADLSPDGRYLYVTCSNSDNHFEPHYRIPGKQRPSLLCVYDTQSGELVKVIDIGSYATGIASREN